MTSVSLRTTHPPLETLLGAALVLWIGIGVASLYWLVYLATLIMAYCVGRQRLNDRGLWVIISTIYVLGLVSILEWEPAGLFGNRNVLGCASALVLAGVLAFRLWFFTPFALFGLWFSGSLTGLTAAGFAVGIWLWRQDRFWAFTYGLFSIAMFLALRSGHDASFLHRLGIWHDTIQHLTPFGAGLGAFQSDYASWSLHVNMYGLDDLRDLGRAQHVYNDFLELTYSLGIGSVLLWFFIGLHLEAPDPANRLIFFTFAVCGLSFFPAFLPGLGHIAALTLGRLYHGKMAPRGSALYKRAGY